MSDGNKIKVQNTQTIPEYEEDTYKLEKEFVNTKLIKDFISIK